RPPRPQPTPSRGVSLPRRAAAPSRPPHASRTRREVMKMGKVEIWASGAGVPRANVRQAVRAEENGFDGIVYVDSQNLSGDCYIALALAAHATRTLQLGTGVTNPVTRHPAVTASAIATVQAESEG